MKRTRIIWGASCAVAYAALTIYVAIVWHSMGCGFWSLFALVTQYGAGAAAVWAVVDAAIKGE